MSMWKNEKPTKCTNCGSEKIYLDVAVFKKDSNGKDKTIPSLGVWMCDECGAIAGRMTSEGHNETFPKSKLFDKRIE